jgi:hypothetical protein
MGADNFDADYSAYRVDSTTAAAQKEFEQLRAELSAGKTATATEGQIEQPVAKPPMIRRGVIFTPEQSSSILSMGGEMASDIGREVGVTATQLVTRIIPGGVIDSVNSTLDAMEDVSNALTETLSPEDRKVLEDETGGKKKFRVPSPPEPTTATGGFLRETTEFVAAFIGPQKKLQAARKSLGLTGKASEIAATELAGLVSAGITFEKAESTLGSLLAKKPELAPVVNEYMQSGHPAGVEVEKRLESALVGLGFGLATRGVIGGLKTLRQARITRKLLHDAEAAAPVADEAAKVSTEEIGNGMGAEMGEALVRLPRANKAQPAEAASLASESLAKAEKRIAEKFPTLSKDEIASRAALEETTVEVNLARINTPEDVRALIQQTTNLFKPSVDEARRGVRSNEATAEAADTLGWSVSDVLSFRNGQAFNAEESLAIRKIHASAAKTVMDLADVAAGPNAGPVDQFRFRKSFAAFEAINESFLGARAEAGRALQQYNIRVSGDSFSGKELSRILEMSGGEAVSKDLASVISRNRGKLGPGQLSAMARKGALARTHDVVRESFTLGLLWNPGTHIVNAASPYIVAAHAISERYAAEKLSLALGRQAAGESFVAPGEAMAMAHAVMSGVGDLFSISARDAMAAFRESQGKNVAKRVLAGAKAARAAIGNKTAELGIPGSQKIDAHAKAITSEALGANPTTAIGRAVDAFGAITRTPGSALGFEDDIGKMVMYRMELHAQALRVATSRGGTKADIAREYSLLLNEPTSEIRQASVESALLNTFTNDLGKIGRAMIKTRDLVPFSFVLFPFIKTPANILMYNFERTPLAPISGRFRADIAAGGARQDIALAKLTLGLLTIGSFVDLSDMGYVHGAGPSSRHAGLKEAYARSGIRPHSIDIGGVNYTINRIDPIGSQISFGATMGEHFRSFDYSEDEMPELMKLLSASAIAAAESSTSKSWLMGVAQVVDMVRGSGAEGPDIGERVLRLLSFQAGNFVPFSSAFRTARALVDDTQPELNPTMTRPIGSFMESIQSQIPILEEKLPRRMNVWGESITFDEVYGRPADALLPTRISEIKAEPIDAEITKHRMDVRRIGKQGSFNGVMINFREFPRVYEKYVELAGNGSKLPSSNKGAKDTLNEMARGRGPLGSIYSRLSGGPSGGKRGVVTRVMSQAKLLAQREILDEYGPHQSAEFDRFRDYWSRKNREAMQLRMTSDQSQQIGVSQ